MKKQILSLLIILALPILSFSQEKLDKEIMTEFYSGFRYALQKSNTFNAIIIASFNYKFPKDNYNEIQDEIDKVEYNFENQIVVFKAIYDQYKKGYTENVWLNAFLKNSFLLDGSTLEIVSDYIANQKYLKKN